MLSACVNKTSLQRDLALSRHRMSCPNRSWPELVRVGSAPPTRAGYRIVCIISYIYGALEVLYMDGSTVSLASASASSGGAATPTIAGRSSDPL